MDAGQLTLYEPADAQPSDPSVVGWPASLPIEMALKIGSPKTLCEAHGVTRAQWELIRTNAAFIAEVGRAVEAIRIDGSDFKTRARLQSTALLKESWRIIHDPTVPASVRAGLITTTWEAAGLNEAKNAKGAAIKGGAVGAAFQIQINLGQG